MKPLIYAMPGNDLFARLLRAAWPGDVGALAVRRFPDGESLVRLETPPGERDVALVCTLHEPDGQLVPLLFAAATARELGARSVGLVAPYLAYMRQDRRFQPGESRSAAHFARLLSQHFDWLVTVDPHLHRYHALDEIYDLPSATVHTAPLLARWIASHVPRPLIVGPDAESRQWVAAIAESAGLPWRVLEKVRSGDRQVEIRVPEPGGSDRTPVLADDIISSGTTLAEVIGQLRAQGSRKPVCVAVHAVFAEWAYWLLLDAGAGQIVTTNTILHASNAIDVSAAVAQECRNLLARLPPRAAAERVAGAS